MLGYDPLNPEIAEIERHLESLGKFDYFKKEYTIKYNEGLELITIRHYDEQIISKMTKGKVILVEQKTRETARFVVKNKL